MENRPCQSLPEWAPRVKQELIRRLYENDAQGICDEDLLNQAGWGLRARCESFITAVAAVNGEAACPNCGTVIRHQQRREEVLVCPTCAWECTWGEYFLTIQHRQLSGAENVLDLFRAFVERFPDAREPREKMLLIDGLIHGFHWYIRFGPTRAAGVNLIEGRLSEVVAFLDALAYGPNSTPGLRESHEEWRDKLHQIEEFFKTLPLKKRKNP